MKLPSSLVSPIFMSLGNPGREMKMTRHSVGHLYLSTLKEKYLETPIGQICVKDTHTLMINNQVMNVSGRVVRSGLFKDKRIILLVDDLELGWAKVRLAAGKDRGHNGVKSVRAALGLESMEKVLIGIGRPASKDPEVVSKHVLGRWTVQELNELNDMIFPKVDKIVEQIVQETLKLKSDN